MWMRISVAFNVLFALLLLGGCVMYLRSVKAARDAHEVAQRNAHEALSLIESRLRQSHWSADRGTVRVEGKVNTPGDFPTTSESPRSLAQLLDDAGGVAADATLITVRRTRTAIEESRGVDSLRTAERQPADVPPGPGDVVIVP